MSNNSRADTVVLYWLCHLHNTIKGAFKIQSQNKQTHTHTHTHPSTGGLDLHGPFIIPLLSALFYLAHFQKLQSHLKVHPSAKWKTGNISLFLSPGLLKKRVSYKSFNVQAWVQVESDILCFS